jgi:hypothetical protein
MEQNLAAAAAQATADAQSAQATIEALGTEQAEAATVAAQNEESGANAAATANAQATALAEIAAVATQNAESGANELATAQAEAEAAIATAEAILAAQGNDAGALATAEAEQALLQQTVEAQSTELAVFAQGNAIEDDAVELTVNVSANGVVNGSNAARQDAIDALGDALAPYASCQAVVVLTYGYSGDIGFGQELAQAINDILTEEFPEIFNGAALKDYANVSGDTGRVDLEIFFRTGCVPGG